MSVQPARLRAMPKLAAEVDSIAELVRDTPLAERPELLGCYERALDQAVTWYQQSDLGNPTQQLARLRNVRLRARALELAITAFA